MLTIKFIELSDVILRMSSNLIVIYTITTNVTTATPKIRNKRYNEVKQTNLKCVRKAKKEKGCHN